MININILFPREKRRIIEEISKKIKNQYHEDVRRYQFRHVGDENVYLYVFLEDDTPLYVTAKLNDIAGSMTICDDMLY